MSIISKLERAATTGRDFACTASEAQDLYVRLVESGDDDDRRLQLPQVSDVVHQGKRPTLATEGFGG